MAFEIPLEQIPLVAPIGVLIDVGAHDGAFAREAIARFQPERYIGFEPLPEYAGALWRDEAINTPGKDRRVFMKALGEEPALHMPLMRCSHAPSSSLLDLAPGAGQQYGIHMQEAARVDVSVQSLDNMCRSLDVEEIALLKIDVQGYEARVLRGGAEALRRARWVVIEILYCQHYEGQSTPAEIHGLLSDAGLEFFSVLRRHRASTGEVLEADVLYGRRAQ